ncbi:hypothetical protein, conserved [Trypanosoma brucei gambiense DAL972]|uniref:Mitochondrial carrier protein n=1 Tax=Trypanosoma brucei gambiense (strain MHOM/CI/86/DAL972) TaxID=679716 RepID=C9ZSF0_TRYB9|nr:hypothetical protein, conserved [Trypanosoma brucei gambiense DAL972]CBH12288.1 hypothetical protein, conserved [Trypanosoma brucei gambiense DAL972]|eukprot:XP_011774569.1 hypothetical protein, conserved [Trypanosoma brucei gambiense DAL972]
MTTQDEKNRDSFLLTAGPALISGAAQAVLFNPFDRALYVRVMYRRHHFLDRRNFEHPFQGFVNAAVYRTLVAASYLFWQDSTRIFIDRYMPACFHASNSPGVNAFLIGAVAGTLNGSLLNGMQVVKYRMWSVEEKFSFFHVTRNVYGEKGLSIFFRGIVATILRDSVFGIVYEMCRNSRNVHCFFTFLGQSITQKAQYLGLASPACSHATDNNSPSPFVAASHNSGEALSTHRAEKPSVDSAVFASNLFAAMLASVFSSPFNYVRSVVYGVPSGSGPVRYIQLLQFLYLQTLFVYRSGESYTSVHATHGGSERVAMNQQDPLRTRLMERSTQRHRYPMAALRWMNSRLNIGWGSARVGLGMAISQSIFVFVQSCWKAV